MRYDQNKPTDPRDEMLKQLRAQGKRQLGKRYDSSGLEFFVFTIISAILVFGRNADVPGPFSDPNLYPAQQGMIMLEDLAGIILIVAAAGGFSALLTLYRKLRSRPEVRHARHVRPYIPRKGGDWELPENWRN